MFVYKYIFYCRSLIYEFLRYWKKQYLVILVKNVGAGTFSLVFSFVLFFCCTEFQTLGIGTKALATSDFPLVLEKSYITAQYPYIRLAEGGILAWESANVRESCLFCIGLPWPAKSITTKSAEVQLHLQSILLRKKYM